MKKYGFTLSEVLITLGIIGIVAAMTLSMIVGHYKKQVTASKLKKTYSVLSQSYMRSVDENGDFFQTVFKGATAGKDYYEQYWKKYLKTVRECSTNRRFYPDENLSPWFQPNGTREGTGAYCNPRTRWIAILPDGVLLLFLIYTETSTPEPARMIFVDINGIEKPNVLGKDVFVFTYDEKGIKPENPELSDREAESRCKTTGRTCSILIYRNGWEIPKDYPVKI